MCHSCGSRNPGCFVPAAVFLLGKRELQDTFWIPAFAGMTPLSRLRFVQPASPTRGEAGCFIRLNSYQFCFLDAVLANMARWYVFTIENRVLVMKILWEDSVARLVW